MSLIKKVKTAVRIFKTRGLKGVYDTFYAKLDRSFRPDETQMVYQILADPGRSGLMIDVGAHHGSSLAPFADLGWQVIAFEPDSNNRQILTTNFGANSNVIIDPRACSDQIQPAATLYASPESSGVSGLSAFLESHEAAEKVVVTTLASALDEHNISKEPVDFLKIDTEGFDLMVLKGFAWHTSPHPKVILCEFENAKTEPLGYHFYDLADYLVDHGYRLVISEWYPVKAYGGAHRWRRFTTYPCQLADQHGWGNIIAVRDDDIYPRLLKICQID
jgi:FkbM family methyltransferase